LYEVYFAPITIFYGGNGSGKSTLLNLIAQKLELNRIAPFNSGEMFDLYADACSYKMGYDDEGFKQRIPNGSRIITSDDIFDYMLTVRTNNADIAENKEIAREERNNLKFGETIKFSGMQDYEALRMQLLARQKNLSRRQFIRRTAGEEVKLNSNGETALRYFEQKLKSDTLYCLDEPENSMSPKMQLELVKMLEEMAHYCDCQFILATHSPFLLAMDRAKIYDLDANPVEVKNWWELENTKIYYEFFKKHEKLFK
jgi:predicted ATPase